MIGVRRALRIVVAAAVALGAAGRAHADADEASMHVHLVGGVAVAGDQAAADETQAAPLAGLGARASYATSDWFQYDAAVLVAGTTALSFDAGMFERPGLPPLVGSFERSQQLARLDAGVTLRGGVRFIPTLRLAVGGQVRRTGAADVTVGGIEQEGGAASVGVDLVGVAAVGLDYRVNRRTILGVSVGGSVAVPIGGAAFQTAEVAVMVAHYFYPRW